jgi:small subunit ribosomal protein S15e
LKKKRTFRKFSYRGIDLDQYVLTHLFTSQSSPIALLDQLYHSTTPSYPFHSIHPLTLPSPTRLLDLPSNQLLNILHARARRRFNRGLKRRPMGLIKKLRKAKENAKPNEKPDLVKTHLRDMIIVPEMIGSVVGVYSGKEFNQVEIKPEMVGFYLGEFSISYRPVKHGRPGIGATHSSRFIPLK